MRQGQLLNDRYRLDERIAAGGMGEVWRGHDERLNRTVAVKVLHHALAMDTVFQHRFQVEARAIAALHHPGIVNIYDFGEENSPEDGQLVYLVMELVDGRSLQQVLNEDGSLDPDETLRIVAATAEALSVAHRAQIIHRDVKPGNILIDAAGAPRIVDFGIARTAGSANLTNTGMVMGTTAYVAPEQLRGDDPSPAADIYSLGVVAYQCLTGRKPFEGDLPAAIIANALHSPPPPLPDEVPEPVRNLVMRALAKDPRDRWDSAAAFAAACRSPQTTPPVYSDPQQHDLTPGAPPPPGGEEELTPAAGMPDEDPHTPVAPPPKRRTGLLVGIIVLLTVLLVVVGGYLVYLQPWGFQRADASPADVVTSEAETEPEPTTADSPSPSDSESESPTDDEPPDNTDDQSAEPTSGELPWVEGLSEEEALRQVEEAGFTNAQSVLDGEGAMVCDGIWSQDPEGGQEYEFDTEVTIHVQTVDDLEDCRYAGAG